MKHINYVALNNISLILHQYVDLEMTWKIHSENSIFQPQPKHYPYYVHRQYNLNFNK